MSHRIELFGWLLFLLSSPLFLIAALRHNDIWSASASIVFGFGVALCLGTLITKAKH